MGKFNRRRLERGQALVEFAYVLPLVLLVLVGTVTFGLAFNNYIALTYATTAGAQQLSISRGQTSDPCNTTVTAVEQAAPYLTPSNFTFKVALGSGNPFTATSTYTGTSCTSATLVQAQTAQVTVTYPCNLKILVFNPAPSCTLTAQTAVAIQ
ncbi:TadE/TadG family type IV pilus assembly protein [Candidatus Binatus soli]|jgi:Flp pilus assembly protein TadG|uniref:TadE/TadG family type IV pilus assembly protein n=1 Tax=Candidatus Binatus soli TaxID=1953413 RepID=UPI003D1316EB